MVVVVVVVAVIVVVAVVSEGAVVVLVAVVVVFKNNLDYIIVLFAKIRLSPMTNLVVEFKTWSFLKK